VVTVPVSVEFSEVGSEHALGRSNEVFENCHLSRYCALRIGLVKYSKNQLQIERV